MSPERQETRAQRRERQRRQSRKSRQRRSSGNAFLDTVIARRNLLIGAGLAAAGTTAFLYGSGIINLDDRPKNVWEDIDYRNLPTKQDLLTSIEHLPPSLIKDMLQERIRPMIVDPQPQDKIIGGTKINVQPFRFNVTLIEGNDAEGSAQIYNEPFTTQAIIKNPVNIKLPYYLLLDDREKMARPDKFPDGTPFEPITGNLGEQMPVDLSPTISVMFPNPRQIARLSKSSREIHIPLNRWLMLKEACTLLAAELAMEDIAEDLLRYNQPLTTTVTNSQNQGSEVSILPALMLGLWRVKGRFSSSIDKAGIVLSCNALKRNGTLPKYLEADISLRAVKTDLESIHLGNTPSEVYRNTMRWCGTNPKSDVFEFVTGTRSNIP